MAHGPGGIDSYLSPDARAAIAEAIEQADGNEVFFVGRPGASGLVETVEVHCRGNKQAVPALLQVGHPGDVVVHNHPSGNLLPSEPDLALAARYGQEGVGFFIVDNSASSIYVVVEPLRSTDRSVDPAAVEVALTGRGALPDLLQGYEPRPGQVTMARRVVEAQNDREILVVEAGTGTGKSLAYLLPSGIRSLSSGERVAISTRTRHLQQQLVAREVPTLQKLYPEVTAAILKGRGNYLCRRKLAERLEEQARSEEPDPAETEFLAQVRDWVRVTEHGDLDDLPFVPDRSLWELVESSTEHTLRVRCPHYDECFYYESRREASKARLLVVNHHLLLADLALRRDGVPDGLLPRYEHIVLDEAHHLEDVATDFAGQDVTGRGVLQQLGRIRPVRGRRSGLAVRLYKALEGTETEEGIRTLEATRQLLDTTEAVRVQLRLGLEDVGEAVWEASSSRPDREASARGRRRSRSFRLHDDLAERLPGLQGLLEDRLDSLAGGIAAVAKAVHNVREEIADMPQAARKRCMQISMDLGTVERRLGSAAEALAALMRPQEDQVRWIELSRRGDDPPAPRFRVRPIDTGAIVRRTVVEGARSLVLTSATLSVAGTFDHFVGRSGLDEEPEVAARLRVESIESPFDYASQVYCAVPTGLPAPRDSGYLAAVIQAVTEAVRVAQGRTFVLFTSYRMLHQVADAVGRDLGRSFSILRQGDLPRDRLIELFRSSRRAVLFGTDSFWEGVDVRGDALSCVILPKLPFRVPTEPIQQARAERIEAAGGDSFADLAVPQAVLKFRQGFGRLIRHRSDRGVVLILDSRVLQRSYGRRFLDSLPVGLYVDRAPLEHVLRDMAEFLSEEVSPVSGSPEA